MRFSKWLVVILATVAIAPSVAQDSTTKVKAINPLFEHRSLAFKSGRLKYHRVGSVMRVREIRKWHGLTRFELTNGHYVTANKKFVTILK